MASYLPPPLAAVLVEEAPEFEFVGDFVYITDRIDGQPVLRRAMRRSVAIRAFARFAEKLRESRLGGAEIIPFPTTADEALPA